MFRFSEFENEENAMKLPVRHRPIAPQWDSFLKKHNSLDRINRYKCQISDVIHNQNVFTPQIFNYSSQFFDSDWKDWEFMKS